MLRQKGKKRISVHSNMPMKIGLNFWKLSQDPSCTVSMFSHWVTFIPSWAAFYSRSGVYTVIGGSCELRNLPYLSPGLQHNTSFLCQHGRICFFSPQTTFYSTFQRKGMWFPTAAVKTIEVNSDTKELACFRK